MPVHARGSRRSPQLSPPGTAACGGTESRWLMSHHSAPHVHHLSIIKEAPTCRERLLFSPLLFPAPGRVFQALVDPHGGHEIDVCESLAARVCDATSIYRDINQP